MDDKDYALIDDAFSAQEKNYLAEWTKNERLFESQHEKKFLDKSESLNRSNLFVPVTQNTVLIAYSVFSSSFLNERKCPIKAAHKGRKEETRDEAAALTLLIRHYWERSRPRLEVGQSFLSALLFRLGSLALWWDKERESVCTRFVPVTDIAFDRHATGPKDVEYLCYRYNLSGRRIIEQIKDKYFEPKKDVAAEIVALCEADPAERHEIKELYRRTKKGWTCKSYLDGKLLRNREFLDIPFKWGIVLPQLPSVVKNKRKEQNLVYGGSFVKLMEQLQREINQKRNQKNDLQEEQINPSAIVDTEKVVIDPSALKAGPGKRIKARTTGNGATLQSAIMWRQTPGEHNLNHDLEVLGRDLEHATGINGILRGNTNPSDRRSQAALATVNANSSTRLEDMIALLNDTLFEHYAKTFARLVYKNAPDTLIEELCDGQNPLGAKGTRKRFDYAVEIEFGNTLNLQATVNNLLSVAQMMSQNQRVPVEWIEGIYKEAVTLMLGENARVNALFSGLEPAAQPEGVTDAMDGAKRQEELSRFVNGTL